MYINGMDGNKCVPTPVLKYLLETIVFGTSNIISITSSNVEGVYDLTVVHPGVKLNCTHASLKGWV